MLVDLLNNVLYEEDGLTILCAGKYPPIYIALQMVYYKDRIFKTLNKIHVSVNLIAGQPQYRRNATLSV